MSSVSDSYQEIAQSARAELTVQSSRFMSEVERVFAEADANRFIDRIRTREHRAHHHCFAWQIGIDKQVEARYSDDGEPSGSAGRPIADQIKATGVTNVLVVVTRYFGGTKLGTGGLVRAYSTAAKEALVLAGSQIKYVTEQIGVELPLDRFGALKRLVSSMEANLLNEKFTDRATAIVVVRASRVVTFTQQLSDILQGRGSYEKLPHA